VSCETPLDLVGWALVYVLGTPNVNSLAPEIGVKDTKTPSVFYNFRVPVGPIGHRRRVGFISTWRLELISSSFSAVFVPSRLAHSNVRKSVPKPLYLI